jgi:hypothetical protein
MDQPGLLLFKHLHVSGAIGRTVSDPCCTVSRRMGAHPLGYTLSWAFLRSPKTQMALSARQREHGLAPSH